MTISKEGVFLLYVDPTWRQLSGPYSLFLYPFWGSQVSPSNPFKKLALETYPFDTSCYGITERLEEADAILMPFSDDIASRYHPHLLAECVALSQKTGKHLVIDSMGHAETLPVIPNTSIIRYGGYRFERQPGEISVPPFADDLLERYYGGTLSVRPKELRARVSFIGWGRFPLKLRVKAMLKGAPNSLRGVFDSRYQAKKKGIFFREQALKAIRRSTLIDSNIRIRSSYGGNVKTAGGDMEMLRREFVDGIESCDYGLEIRGGSNASTRLSEILSLGRIPVIVDTERNLPFSDEIDYREFSIVIDFRDIERLPSIISKFHATLSDSDFAAMQRRAREVYATCFRPDKIMPWVIRRVRQNIAHEISTSL